MDLIALDDVDADWGRLCLISVEELALSVLPLLTAWLGLSMDLIALNDLDSIDNDLGRLTLFKGSEMEGSEVDNRRGFLLDSKSG